MGNIVQCCHTLSNYLKCTDTPAQGEPERSPLLSSEESECESPSLPDDFEDDLLTVSTGVTNPTLEPGNFLFPDLILSSNLGGDVTLVEPMVCLLVSEEEEGVRVDERGGEGQERSNRGYSEVETQTEVETQIGMGVQTQTESQAEVQAQILLYYNETAEKDVHTLTNTGLTNKMAVDVWEGNEILKQADVLVEAPTAAQTSQERCSEMEKSEKQETRIDPGTWSGIDVELEEAGMVERLAEKSTPVFEDRDKEAEQEELKESHSHEELTAMSTKQTFQREQSIELIAQLNTDEEKVFKLQQKAWTENNTLPTKENVKDKEQNKESESSSVMLTEHSVNNMDGSIAAVDPQKNVQPTTCSVSVVENFFTAECRADLTQQSDQDDGRTGWATVASDQNANEKDRNVVHTKSNTDQTAGQSNSYADPIQENPPKREEDDNKTGLQHVLELETALPQVEEEEGAEMKQMTLFSVDRLFLAAPHFKGV